MRITISVVEDLVEVREGLQDYISLNEEFEIVSTHETAEEAMRTIPQLKPDIVIMDINLPGMNGIDCILQIKEQVPGTQFMMFTVYENDDKVFDSLKAGASGYMLKNTSPVQMIAALKDLHNGGAPMSSNIARKLVSIFQGSKKSQSSIDSLSNRENEVLGLLSEGLLYKEIADQLFISVATVRQHIHKIYEKLHVGNRTQALNKAFGRK